MRAYAKVDIINKYGVTRKMEVKVSEAERRASKLAGNEKTHKIIEQLPWFARQGEQVKIITKDPGSWRGVIVIANDRDERIHVLWDELIID